MVYDQATDHQGISERHPTKPASPYAGSKIAGENIVLSYWYAYGLPVTVVRPFNTYGPRQSARAVIPSIITQLLLGETELRLGSITPTRDFNYVKDTARGFFALAESDFAIGKEINIATGKEYSIEDVANILISILNPDAIIVSDEQRLRPEASEVLRLIGDNKLIFSMTDWRPSYDLDHGLQETVTWFRRLENLSRYKSWLYNI